MPDPSAPRPEDGHPPRDERPPLAIGHVVLHATDLIKASEYFVLLGLRPIVRKPDVAVLELRGGTHLVVLPAEEPPRPESEVPFDLMVDDLEATHRRYSELGLSPSSIVPGRIHASFTLTTPDGQHLSINSTHAVGPV